MKECAKHTAFKLQVLHESKITKDVCKGNKKRIYDLYGYFRYVRGNRGNRADLGFELLFSCQRLVQLFLCVLACYLTRRGAWDIFVVDDQLGGNARRGFPTMFYGSVKFHFTL